MRVIVTQSIIALVIIMARENKNAKHWLRLNVWLKRVRQCKSHATLHAMQA
jgi:hypothetical protein